MTIDHANPPVQPSSPAGTPATPATVFSALPKTGDRVFDRAIEGVFLHEGLFSNDPADNGGPTKYGISLRLARQLGDLDNDGWLDGDINHDGLVDIKDIKALKPEQAVAIYKRVFWDSCPAYSKLEAIISIKALDLSVHMGMRQAHIVLQRAVRANSLIRLKEDGILGEESCSAANSIFSPSLLSSFRSEAAGFYRLLVNKNPRSARFLSGWLNRAYS